VTTHSYNLDDSLSGTAYTDEEIETPNVSYTYDSYYARITTMGLDGGGDHDQSRACSDSRFTSALVLMRVLLEGLHVAFPPRVWLLLASTSASIAPQSHHTCEIVRSAGSRAAVLRPKPSKK
jgi:hypothetical protein